jgi:hypothetical protein
MEHKRHRSSVVQGKGLGGLDNSGGVRVMELDGGTRMACDDEHWEAETAGAREGGSAALKRRAPTAL